MQKLIDKFNADKSAANRAKLQAYINKHQMAACMLLPAELAALKNAGFAI